jgi:predicted site-specific integrase-resolvase
MRLSQYAKQMNVSYKTAFRWWKAGRLDAYQLDTGTIIVRDPLPETHAPNGIALYARVSTQGQKADLERLKTYAASWGYQVTKIVQEIASGMNDTRPKLLKLLTDLHIGKVVVEHRDRLTRFGFVYIERHEKRGQEIDQRPDLQLRMARGNDDFMVNADEEVRELEQEAERNGYVLQWTFDQDTNDFAYTCEKMTAEEYEH